MFTECKDYLLKHLKESGIKTEVHTSLKRLRTSMESHIGAVLYDKEEIVKNRSKRVEISADKKVKGRKLYDRNITFDVVIGEYTQDKAERIFEKFISGLADGLKIKERYVPIEIDDVEWVDEDDSILKAKIAVQFKVKFLGGIYRETGYGKIKEAVIREVKKEGANNSGS